MESEYAHLIRLAPDSLETPLQKLEPLIYGHAPSWLTTPAETLAAKLRMPWGSWGEITARFALAVRHPDFNQGLWADCVEVVVDADARVGCLLLRLTHASNQMEMYQMLIAVYVERAETRPVLQEALLLNNVRR